MDNIKCFSNSIINKLTIKRLLKGGISNNTEWWWCRGYQFANDDDDDDEIKTKIICGRYDSILIVNCRKQKFNDFHSCEYKK